MFENAQEGSEKRKVLDNGLEKIERDTEHGEDRKNGGKMEANRVRNNGESE